MAEKNTTVEIVVGTTPTILYKFNTLDVNTIVVAKLTLVKRGKQTLIKQLSQATVNPIENSIQWILSQEDTLYLDTGKVEVMCNWVDITGIRGVGETASFRLIGNHINEVIGNE